MTPSLPVGKLLDRLPGAEVLVGRFPRHHFPRHSHEGLMLSVIDAGAQRITHHGTSHIGGMDSVVAMPPEAVHSTSPAHEMGWAYHSLMIPVDLVGGYTDAGNPRATCDAIIDDVELTVGLRHLFTLLSKNAPTLEIETAASRALDLFLARHSRTRYEPSNPGREERAVARIREYLSECIDESVSLKDLSTLVDLDGYRLNRAFSREVGMPPHAWHLQQRLRRGQKMLAEGYSIADTAFSVGFADQPHFSRAFKRLVGVTPGQFQRAHRRS